VPDTPGIEKSPVSTDLPSATGTFVYCERSNTRRHIAAHAAVVCYGCVDGNLHKGVIDINTRPFRRFDDYYLGQRRQPSAHTIKLSAIRIGRPHHVAEQPVPGCAVCRQISRVKDQRFGCAAAHKNRGYPPIFHSFSICVCNFFSLYQGSRAISREPLQHGCLLCQVANAGVLTGWCFRFSVTIGGEVCQQVLGQCVLL